MPKRPILKCSKCKKTIKYSKWGYYDGILRIRLEGGYAEFVDDIVFSRRSKVSLPLYHYLCHHCAHELMNWLTVPESDIKNWHPLDSTEPLCDGYVFPHSPSD